MESQANISTLHNLRSNYLNVLAYVIKKEKGTAERINCLTKWGTLLGFRQTELRRFINTPALLNYQAPENSTNALAQVYDLVYMVYMDGIIEDIELELVSLYASGTGLEGHVVNNLLKALVAAQIDGVSNEDIRTDIKDHPEVYV